MWGTLTDSCAPVAVQAIAEIGEEVDPQGRVVVHVAGCLRTQTFVVEVDAIEVMAAARSAMVATWAAREAGSPTPGHPPAPLRRRSKAPTHAPADG